MKKQKIAVAIAGGGDKTYVFSGIMFYLKQKYDIVEISTVSGSGYTVPFAINKDSLNSAANTFQKFNLLNFAKQIPSDQVLEKRGLFELDPKIYDYIEALSGVKKGASFKPKFSPYAVNIANDSYEVVNMTDYRFGLAVACSINVPFLFAPIKVNNMELVDGGLAGNVNLSIFSKYKNIPRIVLMHTSPMPSVAYRTIIEGLKYLNVNIVSAISDLNKLIKNEKKLAMHSYRAAKINLTADTPANFIFNLHNINEGLILNEAKKKRLMVEGYMMADHIHSKMDYFIQSGLWRKLENENVIDLNFKEFKL